MTVIGTCGHELTKEESQKEPLPIKDYNGEYHVISYVSVCDECALNYSVNHLTLISKERQEAWLNDSLDYEEEPEKDRSCPCHYLDEPCHSRCTCVNQFSSSGCYYCCTYGSLEQRTTNAKRIAAKLKSN